MSNSKPKETADFMKAKLGFISSYSQEKLRGPLITPLSDFILKNPKL